MAKEKVGATLYPALIGGRMYIVKSLLNVAYRYFSLYRRLLLSESYTYATRTLENFESCRINS